MQEQGANRTIKTTRRTVRGQNEDKTTARITAEDKTSERVNHVCMVCGRLVPIHPCGCCASQWEKWGPLKMCYTKCVCCNHKEIGTCFLVHQFIVVCKEGSELCRPVRQHFEDIGQESSLEENTSLTGSRIRFSGLQCLIWNLWLHFLHKLHDIIRQIFFVRNWIAADFLWRRATGGISGAHRCRFFPKQASWRETRLQGGQRSHVNHSKWAEESQKVEECVLTYELR